MEESGTVHILSIDIGTSGVRASVFEETCAEMEDFRVTEHSERGLYPPSIDPNHLLQIVISLADKVADSCQKAGVVPQFAAVSCFWHSLMGINADGQPATDLYLWSETRPAKAADALRDTGREGEFHDRTGCHFHSSYWPAKLLWLRETKPERFERTERWLSFSDYLQLNLTGSQATSISMASGTGLLDLRSRSWDAEALDLIGISNGKLPPIASSGDYSILNDGFRERWPVFADTKWFPAIGDGAANSIGVGCADDRAVALMIGTSAALRVAVGKNIPDKIPNGLFCYRIDEDHSLLGGALSDGGSLYAWLTGSLGLEIEEDKLARKLADNKPGYHGLSFLPFVFGERSTGYHDGAEGSLIGVTRGTDAYDISIAAMESIAFRLAEILDRAETAVEPERIFVSGGAVHSSRILAQILSDVLGRDLMIPDSELASLSGAAEYGLRSAGILKGYSTGDESGSRKVFPTPGNRDAYASSIADQKRFYDRVFPLS